MKVELARPFHGSRFQKTLRLGETGRLTKSSFDGSWSAKQSFFHIEECYRTGIWHSNREENTESVGEYRRTKALLNFEKIWPKIHFPKTAFIDKICHFSENWTKRGSFKAIFHQKLDHIFPIVLLVYSQTVNTRTLKKIEDSWCEVKDGYCFSGKKVSGVPYKAIRSQLLEIQSLSTHYNWLPSRQFIRAQSKVVFANLNWRNTRRTKMGVVYDINKHSQKTLNWKTYVFGSNY